MLLACLLSSFEFFSIVVVVVVVVVVVSSLEVFVVLVWIVDLFSSDDEEKEAPLVVGFAWIDELLRRKERRWRFPVGPRSC